MKKLITSALPYVNNVPHLGNIIGCVLSADVYARFCRLRGHDTLYVCGTDEYGTATEYKAREEGVTPRQICDKYHKLHKEIYEAFNISFDIFGRTSNPQQTVVSQEIFKDLHKNNLISEQTSQKTYCEKDDIFLADRYVEGECPECGFEDARGDQCDNCGKLLEPEDLVKPKCKVCGTPPVLKDTSHLYINLDELQDNIETWVTETSHKGRWTSNAISITNSWIEKGLQARPITRDLSWGVPVPLSGYENKVFYVWYDAPIGYISMTKERRGDWKDWWQNPDNVQLYQFMAKDNVPFHTVMFPASLMGGSKNWTLLHHINATEYLNYEQSKFSKSRGIGIFGNDVIKTGIDIDLWRFYLLSIRPEKNDSDFKWNDFIEKVNSEFIDNIGNLANRALIFLKKNFDGKIRDFELPSAHKDFIENCKIDFEGVSTSLDGVKIREALRRILAIGNKGNKFFQDMKPWEQLKTQPEHAHSTVSVLAYLTRNLGIALSPYMPDSSDRIFSMMKLEEADWDNLSRFSGLDGHVIGDPEILRKKIDITLADKYKKQFSGHQSKFNRISLKVGKIEDIQIHPNADKLYHLQVDLGENKLRSIVAGLVKEFSIEDLIGKKVFVVANLKSTIIRGVESNGMTLICKKRKKIELLDGSPFNVGDLVEFDGCETTSKEIDIEYFKNAPLKVTNGQLCFDDQPCTIHAEIIETKTITNGMVC